MPINCPNNSYVVDTPRFFDKGGNEFHLSPDDKLVWTAGDETLASLVPSEDTRSARIVPLRTTVGDYIYAYTYNGPQGPVTTTETVAFEAPFVVTGKSTQVISSQALGEPT